MNDMKEVLKGFILLIIGGFLYVVIELLYRGYSHWTMFVIGGFSFYLIGSINNYIDWNMPLYKQMLIGTGIITGLEFVTGCVVNIWLGWNIWDYSNVPFNILGQICLPFCIAWFFLSLVAIVLDDYIRWKLFGEEKPHYIIF